MDETAQVHETRMFPFSKHPPVMHTHTHTHHRPFTPHVSLYSLYRSATSSSATLGSSGRRRSTLRRSLRP